MDKSILFLQAVLGDDGAKALNKASERSTELGNALMPRTVLAWLNIASRLDYEGELPGVVNTYVAVAQSEDGYSGSVAIGDEMYKFEDASLFHVAGALLVALDLKPEELGKAPRDVDAERLGKTIDCLVKARVVERNLAKGIKKPKPSDGGAGGGKSPHGPAAAPIEPEAPTPPTPTAPKPPAAPKAQKPKLPKTSKPAKPPQSVKVSKSESTRACMACGGHQFEGREFVGCLCFRDLAPTVKSIMVDDGFELTFGEEWDREALVTFLETIGRK